MSRGTEYRVIWSYHADRHSDVELLAPAEGEGLFILDTFYYGDMARVYISEDALSGFSRAVQKELELRRAGRSEE